MEDPILRKVSDQLFKPNPDSLHSLQLLCSLALLCPGSAFGPGQSILRWKLAVVLMCGVPLTRSVIENEILSNNHDRCEGTPTIPFSPPSLGSLLPCIHCVTLSVPILIDTFAEPCALTVSRCFAVEWEPNKCAIRHWRCVRSSSPPMSDCQPGDSSGVHHCSEN